MSDTSDPDLRDVFRLLYSEDDWAFSDSDGDGDAEDDTDTTIQPHPHPPLNTIAPEIEVEVVDANLVAIEIETSSHKEKYNKKRFFDALDSLLSPSPSTSSSSTKRKRIYPTSTSSSSSTHIPSTHPIPTLPDPKIYAPYSPLSLLSRLRTFHPYTYSSYPHALSPVKAALHGWINEGREGLKCPLCSEKWGLAGFTDISDEKIRLEVARRLAKGFVERHKGNCAWRIRSSPESLYRRLRTLVHPALSTSIAPLAERIQTEVVSSNDSEISWTSPLTDENGESLVVALKSHSNVEYSSWSTPTTISRLAATLALFTWYPYYPNDPSSSTGTESRSKSSSSTDIVCCRICQRRVGLWSFRPSPSSSTTADDEDKEQQTFDLVNEHLDWCPIRPRTSEKAWWMDLPLLQNNKGGQGKGGGGRVKDLVVLSEKMEKKPWRKTR